MASSNSRLRNSFPGLALGLVGGIFLNVAPAAAQETAAPSTVIIDSRQALPLFPANGYKDGFFVEHSPIGDFGLHIRGTGIYGRDPLGHEGDMAVIQNRFTLHAAALVSLAGWAELGVAMPFILYQDGTGLNLSRSAIGDLRLLGKVNFHLPDKAPQIALSVGIGFQTASEGSSFGAGTISGYPRLIVDMPKLFDKRLHIAANLGAVLAGTKRPCTEAEREEIAKQQAAMMNMPTMGNMTPGTGVNMEAAMAPNCEQRQLGLGNHIMWGVGVSGLVSTDQGFYLTTELIGSFTVGTEQPTKSPLFWTVGIRRSKPNATYFSAAYGLGLTDASPSHTVIVGLGLVWETTPPPKKKDPPTVKVDINVTGLPAGASVTVGGKKGDAKTSGPPGGPTDKPKGDKPGGPPKGDKPAGDKPAGDKPKGEGKPKGESFKATAEVDVPDGLVPAEAAKGDKGGPPKGGGGKGKD